jgi:2-polyprenyl-3-methyl-5-hydroxy-6-metoxy-1,4-benzoquinol methylase
MASSVENHYARHLGPIYTWMVGDIDAAFARSGAELDALPLPEKRGATVLDLGAGFGLHALPLARRGYAVTAIDSCETLLAELTARSGGLRVRAVHADLLGFRAHVETPVDVVLCMGDTLTHLPTHACVESLLWDVAASLGAGGIFAATFRDYDSAPLQDDARFILVRSDAERILTCFLEYSDTGVTVRDLLHQFENGAWRLRVSSYAKLRLAPEWVVECLGRLGMSVRRDTVAGGMTRIIARTPDPGARVGTAA